jgi:alpha-1,3/alpha-1,6-mannosyltransferase
VSEALNIAFLHPELGLGGAERLVVDAAVQLHRAGHRVVLFTTHYDPAQCFEETRQLDVRVHGDKLPRQIGGHLRLPCALARCGVAAAALARSPGGFDLIFCDLVAHMIPMLRVVSRARILFYCHFPDILLTPPRHFFFNLYRAPFDWLEGAAFGMADEVLVNSEFTAGVLQQTFPDLRRIAPRVLYPGVECNLATVPEPAGDTVTFLSINRFDPRKNLPLAVDALACLRQRLAPAAFAQVRLVLAGGYAPEMAECRALYEDLKARVRQLNLDGQVIFLPSISDAERQRLLLDCRAVVYTPQREHFGIVPLEAMAAGRPVVAVNNGGPCETVVDGKTGFLRPAKAEAFAEALALLAVDRDLSAQMGRAAQAHVLQSFSSATFGKHLDSLVREVSNRR